MGGKEDQGQRFHRIQLCIPYEKTLAGAISRLLKGHFICLDYELGFLDHHLLHRYWAD